MIYVDAHRHRWQTPSNTYCADPKVSVIQEALLLPGERFSGIRSINRWYIFRKLCRRLSRKLRWNIIFYNPMDFALVKKLQQFGTIIFDWTEDWADYYQNKYLSDHQMKAILIANKVITVTEELAERAKQLCRGKKEVLFLPNASAWINPGDSICATDKIEINKPRIGFAGHLGPWIDVKLVEQIAEAEPRWNWIFAGRVSKITKDRLKVYENIHLLGPWPFEKLPRLMAQCQVLAAPYRRGFSGDASKLYDYLTLNLPIVCSDVETARRLGTCVRIATGFESWKRAIREGLAGNLRIPMVKNNVAPGHTWTRRSEVLAGWLSQIDS
jgi:glycosyltransferase involved in cell wall biosynthesis